MSVAVRGGCHGRHQSAVRVCERGIMVCDFDRLSDDPRFTEVLYPETELEPETETVIHKKK